MPKNKGRNAFFFFMVDWKKRAEAEGFRFPNGLKDVQANADCNSEWQTLDKQYKGAYEAMAKQDKIASQISNVKKTTLGESINILEQREKEQRKFEREMQENIKLTIASAVKLNILSQIKFCFVHVNWFFTTIVDNSISYFPAEYAIGIFSLENGIEDVHHVIVSAKIPLGYRREAMETSQTNHNVPVEYPGGETDFATMYKKLAQFLEPRKILDKYPALYTTNKCIGAVQSLLDRLTAAAKEDSENFKVYEMESLFLHLANEAYKKRTDREMKYIPAYARHIFLRYTYAFESGFECFFHKYSDEGYKTCSKSVLQQWAWTLCEEFCKPLEVVMRPKIHYPVKKSNFTTADDLSGAMGNISVGDNTKFETESKGILSMTGVSEQHRLKVSTRTYEDEMRRRKEAKEIKIIDHSQLNTNDENNGQLSTNYENIGQLYTNDENIAQLNAIDKNLGEKSTKLHGWVQSTNAFHAPGTSTMNNDCNYEKNFPAIVSGRGISFRSDAKKPRAPFGKGHGHS